MKVFLIHRFAERKAASQLLNKIAAELKITVDPFIMDSSKGEEWKFAAQVGIEECEAIVVYNIDECMKSTNATWEIDAARETNKPLILLDPLKLDQSEVDKLSALYHNNTEFNSYFNNSVKNTTELYKVMVTSSEQLVQRRQTMNAFFIAAIGSLLAFAGALVRFGNVDSKLLSFLVIGFLGITGLALCNSWHNLIDNYGKLNAAKFRVILKLEEMLPAQIFAAEWAALGKGLRPQKYRSFTSTEKRVPFGFAILISFLLIFGDVWYVRTYDNTDHDVNSTCPLTCCTPLKIENQQKASQEQRKTLKGNNIGQKRAAIPCKSQ
jgi:hypothetical protein